MKILMLSTDQNVFIKNSPTWERMIEYGKLFNELHIIVYTHKKLGMHDQELSKNVFAHPTNTQFKPLYFIDAYLIGKKIIRNSQFLVDNAVISSQDPFETALVSYFLKIKFRLSFQIQSHSDFLSPYFWKESFKNKARVLLGKWLIKKADGIRVVSERVKRSLVNILDVPAAKIVVLPIIFDLDSVKHYPIKTNLRKKYSNHDFIILAASRLSTEKNIGLAIRAMAEVMKRNPGSLLLIVGGGPEEKKLKALIEKNRLADNVIFEPWTNDIISYYKTADLFVLTSNYEGGARSPIEAMANGLPVIMTDVAPANEFVINGQNGFVVPVGDWKALADRINQFIGMNPTEHNAFSSQGITTADHFRTKAEYLRDYQASLEVTLDSIFKNSK
ncbi:MAG: hypothetical protein G01um10143_188 [Parcubacteria group bacterium Gr01-1014_3]|nr:MAG: hypothetical protein G01um10143_188 [Parcubacteria group bacterium Gr01-1014_3]